MFWKRWKRRAPCPDGAVAPSPSTAAPAFGATTSWRSLLQWSFNQGRPHGSGRSTQERCPPLPEPVSMNTASPPARPRVVQGRPSVER